MATTAHCIYCFETLSAAFDRQQPKPLAEIEDSWEQYSALGETLRIPQPDEQALAQAQPGTDSHDDEHAQDLRHQAGRNALLGVHDANSRDRLAPSPSSSSQASTPSLNSKSSDSSSALGGTPLSSPSSMSSLSTSQQEPLRKRLKNETSLLGDSPMFITWNTVSGRGTTSLRGCIGTFEAQKIERGLKTYALTSAFEDNRFSPITKSELPSLSCDVTLLTDFENAPGPLQWDLGVHGIRISFTHHGKRYGATFLPHVAEEQGWSKVETVVSLMRKAGWNGRREDWQRVQDLKVVRYQGKKVGIGHDDWKRWRDWVEGGKGSGKRRA